MLYLRRTGFPKGVLSPFPHSPPEIAGPQSNQRGIETQVALCRTYPRVVPQSNQRGIETDVFRNRDISALPPQSNQRGIETPSPQRVGLAHQRLNRTSVGLKLDLRPPMRSDHHVPQSNQRGIETGNRDRWDFSALSASIEPAWD